MLPATAPGGGGGTAATSSCLAQAVSTIAPIPASMIVLKRIAVFLSNVPGIARHRRAPQPPGCGCCAVTVQDLAPDRATREANRRAREPIRLRMRGERHQPAPPPALPNTTRLGGRLGVRAVDGPGNVTAGGGRR